MNYHYESKKSADRKAKIELVCDNVHCVTVIKYPPSDPRDRVDDEYNDDSNQSE